MKTPGLLIVRARVEPGHEDAFNDWYDNVHVPEASSLMGCRRATRYQVSGVIADGANDHNVIAVYEFDDEDDLARWVKGPEVHRLRKDFDDAVGSFAVRTATLYRQAYPLAG